MIDLYPLLSHLKNCPDAFLETADLFEGGSIHTDALVADCFRKVSGDLLLDPSLIPGKDQLGLQPEASVAAIQIACWLFSHDSFAGKPSLLPGLRQFMFDRLPELSAYVNRKQWIEDEDRNEEFVRLALKCCQLLPGGESETAASDRLDALSTIKRQQVLKESTGAFERMMEIRRKMAEQKAREAANVYGRE